MDENIFIYNWILSTNCGQHQFLTHMLFSFSSYYGAYNFLKIYLYLCIWSCKKCVWNKAFLLGPTSLLTIQRNYKDLNERKRKSSLWYFVRKINGKLVMTANLGFLPGKIMKLFTVWYFYYSMQIWWKKPLCIAYWLHLVIKVKNSWKDEVLFGAKIFPQTFGNTPYFVIIYDRNFNEPRPTHIETVYGEFILAKFCLSCDCVSCQRIFCNHLPHNITSNEWKSFFLKHILPPAIQEMGIIFWLNFDHVNFSFETFIFTLNAYQNV